MDQIQQVKNIDLNQVIAAEAFIKQLPDTVELRVEHDFSYGVYSRTLYIPKDIILIGEIHKYENFNILIKGKVSVLIDGKMQTIEAPFKVVSPPGTKRIIIGLEDSIWMTIHGTHERNIDEIEKIFIAHNKQEYLEFIGANQLELIK